MIHILIIDDKKADRERLKNLLLSAQIKFEFSEAFDWETAKESLETNTVNIVFLDYRLPEYPGTEILKKIIHKFVDIPVIMLTGKGDEEVAVNILKLGAYDYLNKEKLTTKSLLYSLHNTIHLNNLKVEAKKSDQLLKVVTKGTSILSGKAFFKELISILSNFFNSEYAFILELQDDNKFYELALKKRTKEKLSRADYQNITSRMNSHNQEFMLITDLNLKGYEHYFGIMIRSRKLSNIGLIGLLKNDRFKVSDVELEVLNVLINRAAVEIEWIKNELKLKNREQELRAIYEHSNDAVVTFVDGKISFANKSLEKFLNFKNIQSIQKKNLLQFLDESDREIVQREIDLIGKGEKESAELEAKGIDTQNKVCYLEIDLSSYLIQKKTTILLLIRDITIRKQMEQEIVRSNKLDSISVLAGGIAHDFNNILTAILGNLTLAKLVVNKDEKIHKKISDAEHATFLAKDLTQQLLTFSKGGNPVKKTTSLVELVKESTEFVLRGSSIVVKYVINDPIYNVNIDIGQINQVINNLIINSKQAMNEHGKIVITIRNIHKDSSSPFALKNGDYVSVSFQDEGPGIAPENLEKIFDPFYTTKKHGSGLGLANCYTIVKKHGGVITVESTFGKGACFTILLPSAEDQELDKEEIENNSIKIKGTALIIDDNQSIQDILSEILSHIGLKTQITDSFESAIVTISKNKKNGFYFDYIIIDLTIPGNNNAINTTEQIKKLSPDSKIVISSGYSNDINITEFKKAGFSGALVKPYRFEDVTQLFSELIK